MKFLVKFLKFKGLLALVALALLVLIVLRAGEMFGWPKNIRQLIVLVVLFLCVFVLLLRQIQAAKGASQIERSIKNQAEEQKQSLRPEKRGEIEDLKNQLVAAIEALKKTKLGKGRSGRAALYALPWYMFIGPPASGKTTAIVNSGLEFPYGNDIKGIGGTRNCDWFFSSAAIILDTAGRYVTEDDDREEWLAFLEILRKHRRKRPINGVVVGMSIADILKENREGLEWHAKNIRRRIDELVQRLGVRFPVYLVLTKCDLLQGFVEVFEGLGRREREQIWGCTFPRAQQTEADAPVRFEQEFDLLIQALDEIRLRQLSISPKPENRGKIYAFPLQVSAVKESISYFLGQLFQPNPYQESPCFRGFYLTSGTQEGVPIDRVIQAILKQFDFPPEVVSAPEIQKKSYFIKDLFQEVIIPDQNSVFQTSKAASQKNFLRIATLGASVVLLAAAVVGIAQGYFRSRVQLKTVKDASVALRDIRWDSPSALLSNLRALEEYRGVLGQVEMRQSGRSFLRLGMDRSGMLFDPASRLYQRAILPFIRNLFNTIEANLKMARQGRDGSWDRDRTQGDLTAYLLMGSEAGRLSKDPDEVRSLKQELKRVLDENSARLMRSGSPDDKILAERQIECFVDCLSRTQSGAFENSPTLVANVQKLLRTKPDARYIYNKIKGQPDLSGREELNVAQILVAEDRDLIFSDYGVPWMFTRDGWAAFVQDAISKQAKDPGKGNWVLGINPTELPAEWRDPKILENELKVLYFQEYAEKWWTFLKTLQYRPFDSLASASKALKRLSSTLDSPLALIINHVASETDIGTDAPGDKTQGARGRTGTEGGSGPPGFARLKALTAGGEGGGELGPVLDLFSTLNGALEDMLNDPGARAMSFAANVLKQQPGPLTEASQKIRRILADGQFVKEAREALFEKPLKMVWDGIIDAAQAKLNEDWSQKVHSVFRDTLARYYPFNREGSGASLADFESFFGPRDGALWKFVQEELGPFVRTGTWECVPWSDRSINLSAETVDNLKKASTIKAILFAGAGGELGSQFQMQADDPPSKRVSGSGPGITAIRIVIDGQAYDYTFGLIEWKPFLWPRREGVPGSLLEIRTAGGVLDSQSFDDEWGWFKLLETARIEDIAPREYRLIWILGNQFEVRARIKVTTLVNPFRDPRDFFSFRCPERLD